MSHRILVVDDDASIRETFEGHLRETGHLVETAASAEEALNRLAAFDPALVITDVRMPGMTGIELLGRIRKASPGLSVLVMTAHEEMRSAVDAMKAGAYDYLVKPLDLDHIDLVIERCLRDRALRRRVRQLNDQAAEPYSLDRLIGRDPRMIEIYKLIGSLAATPATVLIRGETGTGKELIARAIHYNSERADEPFTAVNCTALPETLLESELFGHVRGAFTGATADRRGIFERAGAGTVFLDEIGDISPGFQSKLLRVLQEREFTAVGADRPRRTEARVIAATHRPIERLVREGSFREDLYFRLRVVEIQVPPLRERKGDIPRLARHLADKLGHALRKEHVLIPEAVMRALQAHPWPGNVRELENAIHRALVLARGPALAIADLGLDEDPPSDEQEAGDSLDAVEARHVAAVLRRTGGNKRQACRILEISRPRLDRLIVKHRLTVTQRGRGGNESLPSDDAPNAVVRK